MIRAQSEKKAAIVAEASKGAQQQKMYIGLLVLCVERDLQRRRCKPFLPRVYLVIVLPGPEC